MDRLKGVDSIRFYCALIVLLGHFGIAPQSADKPQLTGLLKVMQAASDCLFNGPAAVIVFFVISGLCIHYPHRTNRQLHLPSYYSRRFLRIGLPAVAAAALWLGVGAKPFPVNETVFWSIVCEAVYYFIYPLLLAARRVLTWVVLVAAAYLAAFGLALANQDQLLAAQNAYTALGNMTWIIGLPCWLLGCWLAENFSRFPVVSSARRRFLLLAVFMTSVALRVVKFHTHSVFSSNCFTLNLFALAVCFWLGLELKYWVSREPNRTAEWFGKWSYSLYLVHPAVPVAIVTLGLGWIERGLVVRDVAFLTGSLAISYLFYLAVEQPSHKLAVMVSRRLKQLIPSQETAAVSPSGTVVLPVKDA